MTRPSLPFHRWLPVVPAVVAGLALLLVVWSAERIVADELLRRSQQRVDQMARLYADLVDAELTRRAGELEMLARHPLLRDTASPPQQVRAELEWLQHSDSRYVWIGWVDPQGRVLVGTQGALEGRVLTERPVFQHSQQRLWFGSPHPPLLLRAELQRLEQAVPHEIADLGLPVRGPEGGLRAVLTTHFDGEIFERLRQQALGPVGARRGLDLGVVDSQGRLLLGQLPPATAAVGGAGGAAYVQAAHPIRPERSALQIGWQVVAHQPQAAALAPAAELQRQVWLWGGLAALLMGGLGAWVSRRWARPYVQLFDAVAERLPAGPQGQAGGAALEALLRSLRNAPVAVEPASPGERLLVQALHDAERIKTMLDGLPAPVYVTDAQQHLVYWNRQAAEVFGWVQAVDLGRPLQEVLHWIGEDGARIDPPAMPAPGSTGPHWMHEAHVRRRDGTDLWGEWRVGWVFDGAGQPVGLLSKVRDTTAEREARERLTEQTETLSAVIQASSDALISTDEAGRVVLFNPAAERIFEVPAQEMLGQPLDRLLPQRHRAAHAGQMQGFADSQTTRRRMGVGRVTGVRPDGQELELEASISQVRVRGRKVLTAILRDVTERVRAERMQLQYQMDLSELAHQLMDQEQKTARRMAQLLHDRLGQTLAALRLSFDALSVQLQDFAGGLVRDRIGTIDRLAHQAIEDVREAMNELRPPFLEDHGLAAALQNECLQRETEAGTARLSTRVAPAVRTQRWPADVEHAAFMVGREALINAIRHAQAYHITVVLEGDAGHLSLQVVDDGLGIAPALQAGKPGHLGVVGMRERALAIGARLELRPASDAQERPGTAVCLHWEDAAG